MFLLALLPLAGCATARLHSQDELGRLAQSCGYALGEIIQDPEEKRLLLVVTAVATTPAEQTCIYRWARPRHLHVVFAQVQGPQ